MKKKIGLVLSQPPAYSETFFNTKIKGLIENGVDVTVFSSAKKQSNHFFKHKIAPPSELEKVTVIFRVICVVLKIIFISFRPAFRLYKLEKKSGVCTKTALKRVYLNSHILAQKLDWVHFGFATMSLQRELVAKAIGAKMGVSLRGYDIAVYPLNNKNCYQRLWEHVDKVHSISYELYNLALKNGLKKNTDYQIITPALDFRKIPMKQNLGVINTPVKILTIGRLSWHKGYIYAFETLRILKQKNIDFEYQIIGSGEGYEELMFAVHQLELEDKVIFRNKLTHKEVLQSLAHTDIYFHPSVKEGYSNAVQEAQAVGLLCVAANSEGLKENIIDEKTGWIVPKRKPQEAADKILEILEMSHKTRQEIATNARNRIKKEFTLEVQKNSFTIFFDIKK